MLCPKCGASVGDRAALCPRCEDAKQREQAVVEAEIALRPRTQNRNFGAWPILALCGGGAVIILLLALLLLGSQTSSAPITLAQQRELDTLYNRCVVVFQDALKQSKEISDRFGGVSGGLGSGLSSFYSWVRVPENQCDVMKTSCARDFSGAACLQQRQVTALFFVMNSVCQANGFKSMGSPECRALYERCVANQQLDNSECAALTRRHGVEMPKL